MRGLLIDFIHLECVLHHGVTDQSALAITHDLTTQPCSPLERHDCLSDGAESLAFRLYPRPEEVVYCP
jgi:hypothetical protein